MSVSHQTYDGHTPICYVSFPSKYNKQCTNCKLITMSSTSTVLEGVMQTVTVSRILLCSTHIVPDTTPLPSDEDTNPLPDNTPLSSCCYLDVSLTTSALLENLEAGEDPFNVLDVGPAVHDPVERRTLSNVPAPCSYFTQSGWSYQKTPEENSTSGDGGQYVTEILGCIGRGQQQR